MVQVTLLAGAGRAAGCVSSDTRLDFLVPAATRSPIGETSKEHPTPDPDNAAAREGADLESEARKKVKPCRVGISQVR